MMQASPETMANFYVRMASAVADATIASTRMYNNMMFATMESARNSLNYTRDNAREASRVTANMARKFEQSTREFSREGSEEESRR
jgi:hypothetical protein